MEGDKTVMTSRCDGVAYIHRRKFLKQDCHITVLPGTMCTWSSKITIEKCTIYVTLPYQVIQEYSEYNCLLRAKKQTAGKW